MTTTIIRPGILVSVKSTVSSVVRHNGAAPARDPIEYDAAKKLRSRAVNLVRSVTSPTSFGLLCPVESERELDEAVRRARVMVDEFNARAKCTRVSIYCLKGRIASTDEEAARAIGSEVAALIAEMSAAIDRLDADAIREAIRRVHSVSAMLEDAQQRLVSQAICQARKAARQIVRRIDRDGEPADVVLAEIQRDAIDTARLAFLDVARHIPPAARLHSHNIAQTCERGQ